MEGYNRKKGDKWEALNIFLYVLLLDETKAKHTRSSLFFAKLYKM